MEHDRAAGNRTVKAEQRNLPDKNEDSFANFERVPAESGAEISDALGRVRASALQFIGYLAEQSEIIIR